MPEIKKGFNNPIEYYPWYDWAKRYAKEYAFLLGARDGYVGDAEVAFIKEMQKRLGNMVIDGIFGDRMAARVGYRWAGQSAPPVVTPRRKIWIWTCPGSGANFDQGPSFVLGMFCKDRLNLNHQPVYFQKGGYLGALGGDPKFSYVEVTWDQCKSIEWLWDNNSDVQEALRIAQKAIGDRSPDSLTDAELVNLAKNLEFEGHLSGYSQSADGVEDALEWLCGDAGFIHPGDKSRTKSTGKYRLLRHCIKLVVQFGNPSTKQTGIANKTRPDWLDRKIRNINKPNDFYAVAPDEIRRAFYQIIIQSEMELPFFVHVLRIAVPIILKWASTFMPLVAPLLGGFGPLLTTGLGLVTGIGNLGNNPLLGSLVGMAGSDKDRELDERLLKLLEPMGILKNIPGLIGLIAALPGLDAHGRYGPEDIEAAYRHILEFRR